MVRTSYALLVDGATVALRSPGSADLPGVEGLHRRMSPANLYLRFFGLSAGAAEEVAGRLCADQALSAQALVARLVAWI